MTHLLGLFIIIIALKLVVNQNCVITTSVNAFVDSLFSGETNDEGATFA